MVIKERSNLLIVELNDGDSVLNQLDEIIKAFKILEGRVSGFGFVNRLEYGVLQEADPIFFNKFFKEELITVSNFIGRIDNREYNVYFSATNGVGENYNGKLISAVASSKFEMIIDIYKTE